MDADTINKMIRNSLIGNGFKGTITMGEARKVIKKVLDEFAIKTHWITVEPDIVHLHGGQMMCNCGKSVIKVRPRTTRQKP